MELHVPLCHYFAPLYIYTLIVWEAREAAWDYGGGGACMQYSVVIQVLEPYIVQLRKSTGHYAVLEITSGNQ